MNNYYTIDTSANLQNIENSLWSPYGLTTQKLLGESGINSNWKYRQYMQKNSNQIMKYNTMQSIYESGNNPYTLLNTNPTNNTPYLYKSTHDTSKPEYELNHSDLKQDYIVKEQMKARMISPSIPTNF